MQVAQMLVVSQPTPVPLLVSLLSDCGRSVPLPRLWLGEPLAPFRRNGEQGGGAFPRSQPGLK
jgi:hypothetical protein